MSYSKGMVRYFSKCQIQGYYIIMKYENSRTVFWHIGSLFKEIYELASHMVVSFFDEIDKFHLSPVLG